MGEVAPKAPEGAARVGDTLRFSEITADSAEAVVAAMADEGDLVLQRLRRGCRCFVGLLADEVAAYGWLSTGPEWIGELGLEIRPPAGDAYVWNCVTLPAYRLRGCFRALLQRVTRAAREEGIRRLWIGSVDGGAEQAVTGAGFQRILQLGVVDLIGLRWLTFGAADGGDPATVAVALECLGPGGRPLRQGLRLARHRRH
jgi:GNAT superfamily N-acetyltransferase